MFKRLSNIIFRSKADVYRHQEFLLLNLVERTKKGEFSLSIKTKAKIRSEKQNAKMWPMLADISSQLTWAGESFSSDDWKKIIMGAWQKIEKGTYSRMVPGLEGGIVVLNCYSTSKLSVKDFASVIEYIYSHGDTNGVCWSDPALKAYESYREVA